MAILGLDAFDQKMRGGNANDIISEFKNRHNKGRRSNLGKPEKSGVGLEMVRFHVLVLFVFLVVKKKML